ncbi:MAG: hypothetical protein C0622_14945 [Desulfuromonas sp.]|nr:MAG: hypothetical protein C0622_14945 [Desulfuromonas sp.]
MNTHTSSIDAQAIKKYQAGLSADADKLYQLILDPDQQFIEVLLKNAALSDDHLVILLKRRDLTTELIDKIHQNRKQTLSHRLRLALTRNPATSGNLIRSILPYLRLFELVDLCQLPGASPDQKLAAERTIIQRLPTTPLGNKITLARRGSAGVVAELLKEGEPQLFNACLGNPRLHEGAVYRFLRSSAATAETISQVARHERWKMRPNLRQAILKHPRTPDIWYLLWLPQLQLHLLKQLRAASKAQPRKLSLIDNELEKRGM